MILAAGLSLAACASNPDVSHFRNFIAGNPADVATPTRGLLVLQGGGDDVDINYVRMGEFAGGGDFVVLRASGSDEYNDYIFRLCRCDSVETIVFESRKASFDRAVIEKIRRAEALFIAGGDQSNYVRYWKGTPVEDAIHYVAAKAAPIGGTSAGMAVMGEFSYSAMSPESLTSDAALANPYHADLTLERHFLQFAGMEKLLTDQHLVERDRIGRTVTMLARLVADGWTLQGRAVAADRETSLHIDPVSGIAQVFGTRDHATPYAYFLRTNDAPAVCVPDAPLTIRNIDVYRLSPGGSFNLKAWAGSGGMAYTLSAERGQLHSSRGDIY